MCSSCLPASGERASVRACVLCVFTLPYTVTDGHGERASEGASAREGVHCTGDPSAAAVAVAVEVNV